MRPKAKKSTWKPPIRAYLPGKAPVVIHANIPSGIINTNAIGDQEDSDSFLGASNTTRKSMNAVASEANPGSQRKARKEPRL